ncbi:MAG: hypothetical protein AAF492_06170 [Verrucomicrobiota bacterium]
MRRLPEPFDVEDVRRTLAERPRAHELVVTSFTATPPKTMKEVAQRYAEILKAEPLKDALRDLVNIPSEHVHDVGWLFANSANNHLKKLLAKLEGWMIERGVEDPHVLIRQDRPTGLTIRVLARGDDLRQQEEAPARFLSALGAKPAPYRPTNSISRWRLCSPT